MISPSKIIPSSTTNTISSSNELRHITEDVESSSSSDSEDNTGTDSKDNTKTHSTDLKLRKMSTNRVQRDQSIVSIRSLSITPSNTPRSSITGRHRKRRSSVATIMRSIGKLKRKSTKEDANSTSTDPNALNRQNSISEAELHQAITEEHEALIESYGIRSLRTSAFFVEQESGMKQSNTTRVPIIRANKRGKWDAFVMCMVVYSSFQIPYDATFRTDSQPLPLQIVEILIDILFAVDIFFNFRTTFYDEYEQIEIFDPKRIAEHYFAGFFFVDLFATIPFDTLFKSASISLTWLNALKMIRLLRLGRLVKKLDDVTAAGLFRLFRIVLGITLLLHWLACALRVIVSSEDRTGTSSVWGDNHMILDTDIDIYVSYFYSTITMMFRSIDEHPHTTLERVFVGIVTIFGSMLQAILFGSVAVLISSFDATQVEYNRHSVEIVGRLKQLQVPRPIIKRTKKFLDLLWTNQHSANVSVNDFLTSLSPVLSTEIKLSLYLKKITSTPFFETCGREVLIALTNCVNTRVYMPGDRVVRRGEFGSWMAFIAKGSVSVLVPMASSTKSKSSNNNKNQENEDKEDKEEEVRKSSMLFVEKGKEMNEKEVAILREGEGGYFGEMALIYHKPRNATIQARSFLRIHQLHRPDFQRIMQLYPAEKVKMDTKINSMKIFKTVQRTRKLSVDNTGKDIVQLLKEESLNKTSE